MVKFFTFLIFLFGLGSAIASVPVPIHTHKIHMEGILPAPYETFSLTIELDAKTDNIEKFELYRGKELIELPEEILNKLLDVELAYLDVSHEMHRLDESRPAHSEFGDKGDWLHISFPLGEMHKAERVFEGIEYFKWGYDSARITIVKDKTVTLMITKLSESGGGWSEKTR